MTDPSEITAGRRVGSGLLERYEHGYVGEVLWFGAPIGVRITREGDGVRCELFSRPQPDWNRVPFIDDEGDAKK